MVLTSGAKRLIEEKYTTRDQKILWQNIYIKDFPLDPPGLFLKTNNFVQQGLNRILGYNEDDEKWYRLRAGSDGGLLLSRDLTTAGAIFLTERQAADIKLIDGYSVGASELITHAGEDVSGYSKLALFISSTENVTIYVQGSDDNLNWFDYKRVHDTNTTWNCDGEKIWFLLDSVAHYIRVLVYATAASTVSVTLHGMV